MIGKTLGHYRIVEKIGWGGMGVVYRAHDDQLDRDVAVKVLRAGTLADDATRRRFRKEALALAKLNHPNIATIYEFGTQDGHDFLVMEYVSGTTLADKVETGVLPEKELLAIGEQIAAALKEAHERGVVHRDLKPRNIVVTPNGQAKVLDFGLAKLMRPFGEITTVDELTSAAGAAGTLPYMSPEQLMGEPVDSRSDIYAAGAVLYEMATGQRPFREALTTQLTDAILHKAPASPSSMNRRISPAIDNVILKALDKEPERRYQTARELEVDLKRLHVPVSVGFPTGHIRKARRGTLLLAGTSLIVILGGWFALRRWVWRAPTLAERDQVLVTEFDNRTGEPIFDQTLRELVSTALEQSRYVRVFPSNRLPEVLRRMERPDTVRINDEIGREICQREGLQALISGSISRLGNSYILMARAVNAKGETLVSTQTEVSQAARVPAAVDRVAQTLRTGLGESRASVEQNSIPLAEVTSSSLDAVKSFSSGKQRLYAGNPREAVLFFNRAVEQDRNFAMAQEYLAIAYEHLGDRFRAKQHYSIASVLANRVTEREKEKILGDYYLFIDDYDQAISHFELLAQLQPEDPAVHLNLSESYLGKLQLEAALSEVQQAVRLQPDPGPKNNLGRIYFLQENTEQAMATSLDVLRTNPNDVRSIERLGRCYLSKGQLDDANRTFERLAQMDALGESKARGFLADIALARGSFGSARSELNAGIMVDRKLGNEYEATRKELMLAALDIEDRARGRFAQTTAGLGKAHKDEDTELALLLGRLYARAQKTDKAQSQLRILERMLQGDDVPTLNSFVNILRADLALAAAHPRSAVDAAEKAVGFENSTLAVETLGHAYFAASRYPDAAREFEAVLSRSNERQETYDEPSFHTVVEDHYWLGRSYQALGRKDEARKHLELFLKYWSQADSASEMYRDARRRLAREDMTSARGGTPTPAT